MSDSDSSSQFSYLFDFLPFGLSSYPVPILLLAYVYFLYQIFRITSFIWVYFLRPGKRLTKYGSWAVVTGATDGIGKSYAFQLAKKGLNVLLVSRNESKLKEVAKEVTTKYPSIKVEILAIDFSDFDDVAQEKISRVVKGLEVGVLVNNVGLSYEHPELFHELNKKAVKDLLAVNLDSTVFLTYAILPQMLARGSGAIVNISSVASLFPTPLLSVYSSAKSFVDTFSKSLYGEYGPSGISVQVQNPFFVATKMAKMRPSFTVPTADQFVKASIRFIGHDEDQVIPYWPHALTCWLYKLLPEKYLLKEAAKINKKVKAKALQKKAQGAKRD